MAYQSTNPYTGKVDRKLDVITDDQLEERLEAAQQCFATTWRDTSFAQRKSVLAKAAALMRERSQELASLITLEMGKLIQQSLGEVTLSAAILDYYADNWVSDRGRVLGYETRVTAGYAFVHHWHPVGRLDKGDWQGRSLPGYNEERRKLGLPPVGR